METQPEPEKRVSYIKIAFFTFLARTIVFALSLLEGPYFSVGRETRSFKIFTVFLDVTNIFQFIFLCDVIQRKNLFQFLLYIPILAYSLALVLFLLIKAHRYSMEPGVPSVRLSIGYIYVYLGILVFEVILHPIVYRRLKSDLMWSNFKKIGANPVINEAFKRREQFNAIRRFIIMFLCNEIASFNINIRDHTDHYFLVLGTLAAAFVGLSILPNDECVNKRRLFLLFSGSCTLGGVAYTVIDIVRVSLDSNARGGLILENIFYTFAMGILFSGALRDYQMFGSGLEEYYRGTLSMRKNLSVM